VAEESELLRWFRAVYEEGNRAWNEGDFRRAYGGLPEDCEYHLGSMWPEARPLRGPEEVAGFFAQWSEAFPNTRTDIREYIQVDDRIIVVSIEVSGTGDRSGAPTNMAIWQVWETREDLRPLRVKEYAARDEALVAAKASSEAVTR
jgi:hypothetical protein